MKLSAPKSTTFYIAVVLAILGLIGMVVQLGAVTTYAFWLVLVGFVVLTVGVTMENM